MTTDSKTRGGWMRGLAVLGLVVGAGLTQGCVIQSSSCGLDSALTIDWVVTQGGVSVACPAGSVVTMIVDNDTMIVDFPCSAHAGTTLPTLDGSRTHDVSFYLMSDGTAQATVLSSLEHVKVPVGCGVTQPVPTVDFQLGSACQPSALTMDWVVTEGGRSVACPTGSVVTVMVDDTSMIVDFPCSAFAGTTPATLKGNVTHDVSFYLMSNNTASAATLSKLEHVQVPIACGVTQQLSDTVEFSLTPL